MSNSPLEQLVAEAKALPPDDQRRLRDLLTDWLTATAESSADKLEQALQQKLAEKGLLKRLRPPLADLTPYQNRAPIEVAGQPLSETIVEERR